jgi:hypothetical protein
VLTQAVSSSPSVGIATLIHESASARSAPACTRLSDGTVVWVTRYDPNAGRTAFFCPTRNPQFYDPGLR